MNLSPSFFFFFFFLILQDFVLDFFFFLEKEYFVLDCSHQILYRSSSDIKWIFIGSILY
jgi:hypothetical protein